MQAAIQFGNQRPPNYKRLKINQMRFGNQRLPNWKSGQHLLIGSQQIELYQSGLLDKHRGSIEARHSPQSRDARISGDRVAGNLYRNQVGVVHLEPQARGDAGGRQPAHRLVVVYRLRRDHRTIRHRGSLAKSLRQQIPPPAAV